MGQGKYLKSSVTASSATVLLLLLLFFAIIIISLLLVDLIICPKSLPLLYPDTCLGEMSFDFGLEHTTWFYQ